MLLRWSGIMADAGEAFRANEEIQGREENVFRSNNFALPTRNASRVNTKVQYRVMRVADGNRPTRQMYCAAVVSVHDSARRSGFDVRAT